MNTPERFVLVVSMTNRVFLDWLPGGATVVSSVILLEAQ